MKSSGLSSRGPPYEQAVCLHFLTLDIGICDDRNGCRSLRDCCFRCLWYGMLQVEKVGVKKQMLEVKNPAGC